MPGDDRCERDEERRYERNDRQCVGFRSLRGGLLTVRLSVLLTVWLTVLLTVWLTVLLTVLLKLLRLFRCARRLLRRLRYVVRHVFSLVQMSTRTERFGRSCRAVR